MDCLIAMRKPLRKPQLAPTFVMLKKSKKVAPKAEEVSPKAPSQVEGPASAPVCFVDLYRHCGRGLDPRHVNSPADTPDTTTDSADSADTATDSADTTRSNTSLVTRYPGRVARAHLMYELEYGQPYDYQPF